VTALFLSSVSVLRSSRLASIMLKEYHNERGYVNIIMRQLISSFGIIIVGSRICFLCLNGLAYIMAIASVNG